MSTEINFESKDLNVSFTGDTKYLVTFEEVGNQFVQFTGEDNFSVAFEAADSISVEMDVQSFEVSLAETNISSVTFIEVQDLDIEFSATPAITVEFAGVGVPGPKGDASTIANLVFQTEDNLTSEELAVEFTEVVANVDGVPTGTVKAKVDVSDLSTSVALNTAKITTPFPPFIANTSYAVGDNVFYNNKAWIVASAEVNLSVTDWITFPDYTTGSDVSYEDGIYTSKIANNTTEPTEGESTAQWNYRGSSIPKTGGTVGYWKEYATTDQIPDAGDENVQGDWTETDPTSDAFIKNKTVKYTDENARTATGVSATPNSITYKDSSGVSQTVDLEDAVKHFNVTSVNGFVTMTLGTSSTGSTNSPPIKGSFSESKYTANGLTYSQNRDFTLAYLPGIEGFSEAADTKYTLYAINNELTRSQNVNNLVSDINAGAATDFNGAATGATWNLTATAIDASAGTLKLDTGANDLDFTLLSSESGWDSITTPRVYTATAGQVFNEDDAVVYGGSLYIYDNVSQLITTFSTATPDNNSDFILIHEVDLSDYYNKQTTDSVIDHKISLIPANTDTQLSNAEVVAAAETNDNIALLTAATEPVFTDTNTQNTVSDSSSIDLTDTNGDITATVKPQGSTFELFMGVAGGIEVNCGDGTERCELFTHNVHGAFYWFYDRLSGEWTNSKLNAGQTLKFDLAGNDIQGV